VEGEVEGREDGLLSIAFVLGGDEAGRGGEGQEGGGKAHLGYFEGGLFYGFEYMSLVPRTRY
jgi:hypothetical protein